MKKKFELKCGKVKGIKFHPTRQNLVVISLYIGEIQIWDFQAGQMICKLQQENESCVRSVDFHPSQSLIIAGGDDFIIRGWNFIEQKKMFELKGHSDYLRTVEFHHELPWILSASDDQTLRIWNWQSKTQISLSTGHSHYIMCATFHKNKNLIASCSLDSHFRIWDYSKLKEKFSNNGKSNFYALVNDVECIMTIEAHVKGINWIDFHPEENFLLTCSDDKLIKLWKYTESNAFEQQTFHGHSSVVSCVKFMSQTPFIVSNSEDCSLRLWDQSGLALDKFEKEDEKQWLLDLHNKLPLIATGTDKHFIIKNIFPTNIAFSVLQGKYAFFYSNNETTLKMVNFKDGLVVSFDKSPDNPSRRFDSVKGKTMAVNRISSNNKVYSWLRVMDDEKYLYYSQIHLGKRVSSSLKRTEGQEAVFLSKDKMVVRNKKTLYSLSLDSGHKNNLSFLKDNGKVERVYQGTIGKVFYRVSEGLVYYDIVSKKEIGKINDDFTHLQKIIWNERKSYFVAFTMKSVNIYNRNLQIISEAKEDCKIISVLWTNENFIIYNTHEHLKFLLLNGERGIIKSLDKVVFLLRKEKQNIFTLDFEEQLEELETDLTDLELKNSLLMNDLTKVKQLIKQKKFLGNSLTSFLLKKGYNSLALQLSSDPEVAFYLALSAGNLEKAFNISRDLNSAEKYRLLSREAMRLGSPSLADMCLSLAGGGHRHLMHNLITGNSKQMDEFPSLDITHKFNNSLFSGDIRARIKALSETGQLALAYATAKTHGVVDYVQYLKQAIPDLAQKIDEEEEEFNSTKLEDEFLEEVDMTRDSSQVERKCLIPVRPIVGEYSRSVKIMDNWPLFDIPEDREIFRVEEGVEEDKIENKFEDLEDDLGKDHKKDLGIIGGDFSEETPVPNAANDEIEGESDAEEMWGEDDSVDLGDDSEDQEASVDKNFSDDEVQETVDVFIQKPDSERRRISQKSMVAWEQFALSDYAKGGELLRNQIGLKSPEILKKLIVELSLGSEVYCGNALNFSGFSNQLIYYPIQGQDEENEKQNDSNLFSKYDLTFFKRKYQEALSLTSKAKFQKAKAKYKELLKTSVFARMKSQSEVEELQKMITAWCDYIFMINAKSQISKKTASLRIVEVSLLMSLCRLEDIHRVLILKLAATNLYKQENFVHCLYVLRKFLGLVEKNASLTKKETISKMKKMQSNCEAKGGNKVNFEFSEKFLYSEADVLEQVDYQSVKLHYGKGFEKTECPFDKTSHCKSKQSELCSICEMCELGYEAVGLKFF